VTLQQNDALHGSDINNKYINQLFDAIG